MKAFRYLLVALVATIFVVGCKKDTVEVPTPEDSFILDVTKDYPLVSTDPAFISSETTQTVTVIVNGKGTFSFSGHEETKLPPNPYNPRPQ